MTTAYWFDLDGTLLGYERSFEALLEDTLEGTQPTEVHETFRQAMFVAFETFDDRPYVRGFEAIADDHAIAVDPPSAAANYRERELAATHLAPGAHVVIEATSTIGPVGILTNGDGDMQRTKAERHGLADRVDALIVSNEVGARKPDAAIFELARERLPADEHVYVGDRYEEDIVGARDAGFHPVHVRHDDGPPVSLDRLASLGLFLAAPDDTH